MDMIKKILKRWLALEGSAPSPRLEGLSVDDGTPSQGRRYGGDGTIHNTGTVDIQLDSSGQIVAVWFRCQNLAWRASYQGSGQELYSGSGARLAAIEVVD